MTKEAMKLALEALEGFIPYLPLKDEAQCNRYDKAITAIKEALAQEQEPVAHSVIAGVLFDFMGWLTSRKERIVLSSADNASPAADAIRDFANMRGLSLDDAKVLDWNTTPPQRTEQEPVAFDCCGNCLRPKHEHQGDNCPKPYTCTWNAWDYPFAPDTTPPQRTWVGLTDDDRLRLWLKTEAEDVDRYAFAKAVEAALKELNT